MRAAVVHALNFALSQMWRKFVDVSASILVDIAVGVDRQGTVRVYRDDHASDVCLHVERDHVLTSNVNVLLRRPHRKMSE